MANARWLLDTNVISETRREGGNQIVKAWLKANPDVAIPFPVWYEIERGIILDPDRKHAELLREWRERLRETDYDEPPLTFEVAIKLAAMHLCPPLANLWLTDKFCKKSRQDLLIAAIAIVHDYTIVTRDIDDFLLIHDYFELPGLYCPFTDYWAVIQRDSQMGQLEP